MPTVIFGHSFLGLNIFFGQKIPNKYIIKFDQAIKMVTDPDVVTH